MRWTVSWRPTMSSAPAKRCRQSRWLMTATGAVRRAARAVVVRREHPAADGRHAEHGEEPAADVRAVHEFSLAAVDRSNLWADHANAPSNNSVSRALISSQIGYDHDPFSSSARLPGSRTGNGRRIRLLKIENSAVLAPMPSASVSHGDGRNARISSELAEAVPQILCEFVDQRGSSASLPPCARPDCGSSAACTPNHRTAEAPHDAPHLERHPLRHEFFDAHIQVNREAPRPLLPGARRAVDVDTKTAARGDGSTIGTRAVS